MTSDDNFACPTCRAFPITENRSEWVCPKCGAEYETWHSVPLLFPKHNVSTVIDGHQHSLPDVRRIYDIAYEHDGLMGTDLDRTYDAVTKTSLLRFAKELQGKRVLDLGAGVGNLWQYVTGDVDGYAVDLSPVGMAKARERYPWLIVCAAIGESLPFVDCYFDVVVAADAIEHTFDPEKTLAEIHRVLRPNGVFAASFPVPDSLRKWGWNQIVGQRFDPRFLFQLGKIIVNRMRLFGKATFQPIDRDLHEHDWRAMLEKTGFVVRDLISWPESPQAPIVYLVHGERCNV